MIRLYKNNCEDFNNNGLGILSDFKTSPRIKESLNGIFELNFDYALKGQNAEYLVVDNVIKAPYDGTYQLFRIKKVRPSLTKINVYAVHIFYDLSENFLVDVAPTKKSGVNAIAWLLENAMFPTKFSVTGDITPDNSARYIRKNIVDAILGADNCIVKRWGGEIERDNFNIIYHRERGKDRGVYIKHGKNIKEIELSIDFTTIITRIIPQGANELLLPELYVDSPIIDTYRNPIVAKYEFSDITVDEETTEEEAYTKLRQAANDLFTNNGIDKPTISVSVNWLELSKTEEYKYKYSNFEYVKLGDTVTVEALGYKYKIRVISVEYDCLLNRYVSFEIGDPKADYVSKQSENIITEIQKNSSSLLHQAKQAATALINNGFGGHVRIYPDRILIMDTEDELTAKNVWQWNLNGFAHSPNGINGDYQTAITIDGHIVADRITTGKIKTNVIEGYDSLILSVKNNTDAIGDRTGKLTTITQDINSIAAQISDIADITTSANTSNGVILSSELKNIASSFPIRIEIKPINTNISYLYPNSKLFPSDKTFLKTRKLRFTNESTNEIFDYILPENLLYYDETTYDEFIADYESNICRVIKKCKYNADGTVSPLSEPITKYYNFVDEIQNHFNLTEGNYNVKLLGYQEGYIFVRLMVLNAYTAQYATKVELSSLIKQTSKDIISQVSLTYETKDYVEKQYSEIKQTTNSISQTVANNNTKANIVEKINDNTSQVEIEADNININGMINAINNNTSTTINGNKIATGSITADKIQANSITSNQVASDIITTTNFSAQQINADNITSGSLSADRINGGTINANNINVTNINGTNVNRGTISGASINIYNGTGFFKMLSGSAYHPYVSALNVAAYANSPSASGPGLSFRSSNNRDSTGNQIGYISYGSNGNAIYHSNGSMNIDSGGNLAIASGGYIALRTGDSSSDAIYVWNKIDLNANGNSSVWAKGNNLASGKVKTDNGSASSRIVKENIEEFKNEYDEAYELLKQIKLYSYDYKYNLYKNKHQFGFIIDDIEKLDNYSKFFDFQSSIAKVEGNEIDFSSYDGYTEDNKPDDCIVVKKYDSDVLDKYLLTLCKAIQNKIDKLEEKINGNVI